MLAGVYFLTLHFVWNNLPSLGCTGSREAQLPRHAPPPNAHALASAAHHLLLAPDALALVAGAALVAQQLGKILPLSISLTAEDAQAV